MRVSCSFVLLAIFFAAESQCAPLNPLNVVNHLGGHLESTLTSAPIAQDALTGNLNRQVNAGTVVHKVGGETNGALQSGTVSNVLDGSIINAKRQLGLPTAGLSNLVPGMPSMDALPSLNGLPSLPGMGSIPAVPSLSNIASPTSLPGINSLPVTPSALPGLNGMNPMSAISGLSGMSPVPLGAIPGINNIPSIPGGLTPGASSIPVLGALPIPGLKTKRGFGNFASGANSLPFVGGAGGTPFAGGANGFPFSAVNGIPLVGGSGVGSPFDAMSGFFGSAGGLTNPLTSMF